MFAYLIPALVLVVCTEGYQCDLQREDYRHVYAQPSFELCLENLKAMPARSMVFEGKQQFDTAAACAMVSPEEVTHG